MPPLTVAKLIAAEVLRRVPWGGEDDAALRTTHAFTFGARREHLNRSVDLWKARMAGGVQSGGVQSAPLPPPRSLFDGSSNDLSKQVGWKAVANELYEHGSLGLADAAELFVAKSAGFRATMTELFYQDGSVLHDNPRATTVNCELFTTLPLLGVPYRAPGQVGVRPMLLFPDVPALSDAELEVCLKPVLELRRMKDQRASASSRAPPSVRGRLPPAPGCHAVGDLRHHRRPRPQDWRPGGGAHTGVNART